MAFAQMGATSSASTNIAPSIRQNCEEPLLTDLPARENRLPDLPVHEVVPLLSSEQIAERVGELASAIAIDYPDPMRPLLLIGVLKGAAIFLADLIRKIQRPVEFDFVAVSSYGAATQSSGEVRLLKDLEAPVAGKDVLIVEDILDTGLTLRFSYLVETLRARHARSVTICVLLDKPSRRRVEIEVGYRGFVIPDQFVVGYGMDYAERYRNLPYVGVVSFTGEDASEDTPDPEAVQISNDPYCPT